MMHKLTYKKNITESRFFTYDREMYAEEINNHGGILQSRWNSTPDNLRIGDLAYSYFSEKILTYHIHLYRNDETYFYFLINVEKESL